MTAAFTEWPGLRVVEAHGDFDLAAIQAAHPERYPALFRTTGAHPGWDILFACPVQIERVPINEGWAALSRHPAMQLRPAASSAAASHGLPFTGGWLACLSYELGSIFEPAVGVWASEPDFPVAWLARIPAAILRQPEPGKCFVLAESEYANTIETLLDDIRRPARGEIALPEMTGLRTEAPETFLQGVLAVQDYIRAGDAFQVNLSRLWEARFAENLAPSVLFSRLTRNNPAPFSALWQWQDHAVVSSSPERLVRVGRDGHIATRPIAGTHPRGQNAIDDAALRSRLVAHPKERAEHVMLVDLERNDLGRVCVSGSVRVSALMEVKTYQFVHHIESTITGRLRPEVRVLDILRAVFPGGTITGCPKVRTMQIIRELEQAPREAYTGGLGYINHDGSLDFNILIRSFQLRGDHLRFRAGAGIVADSDAPRELEETRAKARGLLRTLGVV